MWFSPLQHEPFFRESNTNNHTKKRAKPTQHIEGMNEGDSCVDFTEQQPCCRVSSHSLVQNVIK